VGVLVGGSGVPPGVVEAGGVWDRAGAIGVSPTGGRLLQAAREIRDRIRNQCILRIF
jgi:hypothetical protein